MALIQDWVDTIGVEVPEAVEPTIARHVRFALQEFCRESEVWRGLYTVAVPGDGTDAFVLALPAGSTIFAADYAYFTPVDSITRRQLTSQLPERFDPNAQGLTSIFAADGDTVEINPAEEEGSLDVGVILTATKDIAEFPDNLTARWFSTIRAGALAGLLEMPDKPWSNVGAAARFRETFGRGIMHAKRAARRDRSRPARGVRYGGIPW